MRIVFEKQDPQTIVEAIKDNLAGRKLGKLVHFELTGHNNLEVIIKKMGTSSLTFAFQEKEEHLQWDLTKEKIALSHRAFKGEVMDKLVKIVSQMGGQVVSQ